MNVLLFEIGDSTLKGKKKCAVRSTDLDPAGHNCTEISYWNGIFVYGSDTMLKSQSDTRFSEQISLNIHRPLNIRPER